MVNYLTVVLNLIGGESDETSDVVAAHILFEAARTIAKKTGQGLPDIDLCSIDAKVSTRLNIISVIGGGHKNVEGSYSYLAVRFTRAN
jgi:hypothetical protein